MHSTLRRQLLDFVSVASIPTLFLFTLQRIYSLSAPSSRTTITLQWIATILCALLLFAPSLGLLRRKPVASALHSISEPPLVPSYLPWLGCAITYLMGPANFLRTCSQRYGMTFKFLIGGNYVVAISSPTAIANFLRDRTGVFDVVDYQLIPLLSNLTDPSRNQYIYEIVEQKALVAANHGLSQRNLPKVSTTVNYEIFKTLGNVVGKGIQLPVLDFVQRSLYVAVSNSLLGSHFPSLATFDDFITFDDGAPSLLRKMNFLARPAYRARERLISQFARYIDTAWREEEGGGGSLEGASEVMSDIVRSMKNSELTKDEAARLMSSFFWGSHTNMMRTTTWMVRHLATDSILLSRIQRELQAAVDSKFYDAQSILHMHPRDLDGPEFALLTSFVKEVLRMNMLPTSIRVAVRDTTIASDNGEFIIIRKGEQVLANLYGLHHAPHIHDDPDAFRVDRFLNVSTEEMRQKKTLSTFASGQHMCAGRHFAMHTMRMFVIQLLHFYDIKAAPLSSGVSPSLPPVDRFSFITVTDAAKDIEISIQRRDSVPCDIVGTE
ncbi:cytochrome P450 [Crucibulum laeve]|uniref:Cytochrome P450 n=1 Tax=Crucibulum laeve TaxID=68775 RepID=A0A5C3LG50_9AGAR|nr:cytochrome P450 [Crucibulum laeve]